jgi:hypothetical protein
MSRSPSFFIQRTDKLGRKTGKRKEPPKGTKTPKGKKGEYMYGADKTQIRK